MALSIFRQKEDDGHVQVPEVEVKGDDVTIVNKDDESENRKVKMPKTKFSC